MIVFLALNSNKNISDATAMKFGLFGATDIFEGRWYALITSAFVHIKIMHIFFNMYWLWILGPVIERQMGPLKFAGFILVTAVISSGWQLASGHTGIGFSGVGYAIIGYGWIARQKAIELRPYFTNQTLQIFAGWAVLCVFLDAFGIEKIGNIAHVMGAAGGAVIAFAFIHKKWYAQIGLVAMTAVAIIPVYWNLRSSDWNFAKGSTALQKKDYPVASKFYRQSVELDPKLWEAWYNICLIDAAQNNTDKLIDDLAMLRKVNPKEAENFVKDIMLPGK